MAQVFLCQNKIRAEIRLNDEVKAEIVAVFKPGIKKGYGKPVFESVRELARQQDKISKIRLTNEDDPNSAHITMLYFKGNGFPY
jgi:hypothetical protein